MKKLTPEQYLQKREELLKDLEDNNLTLGQFVRQARRALAKTQVEYAKVMKIDPKVLSNLENDKANVTLKTVTKLLAPWGVKLTVKKY